jgi:hypothetical protein
VWLQPPCAQPLRRLPWRIKTGSKQAPCKLLFFGNPTCRLSLCLVLQIPQKCMYPIRSHPAKLFGHPNCTWNTWNTLSRCIVKVSTDSHWSYPRACEQLVLFVCGDNIISLRCLACRGDGSQLPNLRLLLDHLPPQPLHQHLVRQRRPRVHLLCPVPRHIHMSVTRWGVTPRNASLGPCATVPWIFFGKRYGDVIPTSIGPLRRGGTRDHRGGTGDLPSLLAPSKTNRLIDFYDVILMMGVTMLLGTSDR